MSVEADKQQWAMWEVLQSHTANQFRERLHFLVQMQRNGVSDQEEASGQDEGHQSRSSTVTCTTVFSVTDASMAQ